MTDTQPCEVRNLSGNVVEREMGRQLHTICAAWGKSAVIGAHGLAIRIRRATGPSLGLAGRSRVCDGIKLAPTTHRFNTAT